MICLRLAFYHGSKADSVARFFSMPLTFSSRLSASSELCPSSSFRTSYWSLNLSYLRSSYEALLFAVPNFFSAASW